MARVDGKQPGPFRRGRAAIVRSGAVTVLLIVFR